MDLITTKQACDILHVDKSTLGRWRTSGRITPAYTPPTANGAILWNRDDIEALAQTQATA